MTFRTIFISDIHLELLHWAEIRAQEQAPAPLESAA